ncbi:MAG: ABC transporter ATP-binding protein [Nibricoccus sp.]
MKPPATTKDAGVPMLVQRLRDEDDDEPQFKPLEWGIIRRLIGYTRLHGAKRNWLVILTIMRAAQLPSLVWLGAEIITGPIAGHETSRLFWWIAGYFALAVFTDGCFHFRQRFALELGELMVNHLRSEIFSHVQRMPMSFFHRVKLGRIISRVTSDIEAIRLGVQDSLFVSIVQIGQMFFVGGVMLWLNWRLFCIVLALAPVLWSINRRFRMRLSRDSRAAQESFSRVTATLAESVNGIRVTQSFVRQETNAGLFRRLLADHSRYSIALARTSAVLTPLLELNSQFFVAILLTVGGWGVLHHGGDIGVLIKFFLLANMFFAPIQVLGNQYTQALIAMAGAERVFRLLDMKPDWQDAPDAVDLPDPRVNLKTPKEQTAKNTGAKVEFRNVSFGYELGRPVLREISFSMEPGRMVALVGHTGSGKSTIVNLVSKFYLPSEGELFIDDREVRTLTSHSLHRQMGMVQQQNFLFAGTVLDNIRLGRPEATDDEVRDAARRLDCLDLLEALPQGLLTEVGERGGGLSVGQRQLVCFTRALLADPRILILDEATSSIDAITEARLQKALVALLRGRTSFVVAHRLSTIRHADLVLVLDGGFIVERGTHAELLSLKKHYAALHRQFVQVDAQP